MSLTLVQLWTMNSLLQIFWYTHSQFLPSVTRYADKATWDNSKHHIQLSKWPKISILWCGDEASGSFISHSSTALWEELFRWCSWGCFWWWLWIGWTYDIWRYIIFCILVLVLLCFHLTVRVINTMAWFDGCGMASHSVCVNHFHNCEASQDELWNNNLLDSRCLCPYRICVIDLRHLFWNIKLNFT